jgi:hypothetical protein
MAQPKKSPTPEPNQVKMQNSKNIKEDTMQFDQNSPEFQKQWAKIVAQAWADEQFKERLLSDTNTVLQEHGIEVPEGINLTINEAANLSAPQGQPGNKVSFFEEQLNTEAIAVAAGAASSEQLSQPITGGGTAGSAGTAGCIGTVCGTGGSILTLGSAGSGGSGLPLPQPPESAAQSTSLQQPMTGGSTVGTGGSLGSAGTVCASIGSFGTAGTAGSAGGGLTLPQSPPASSSEQLAQPMTGGGTAGTGGTAGSAGTICGTAACVFCAGTAGSAGSGLPLPQPPESAAQSTSLQQPMTGGSTAGSTGSIGSFGTFCGTTGSFATAGTAGTGGSGLPLPQPPESAAQSTSLQQPMTGGSTAGR